MPHNSSAQSYCLIPDLDAPDLGGKSTTVINSYWFNKLRNSQGHTDLPPKRMFHTGLLPNSALQRRTV